jgi:hypothetical protein
MRRRLLRVFSFAISLAAALPCAAQTLAARPAVFGDPVPGSDVSKGELVLGRTTLTAALRIFAVELGETVTMPRRHSSNPDTLPTNTEWQVGDHVVRPRHSLDLGPGLYRLYFDENKRLVVASTSHPPRAVLREELVARYPTLKFEGRRGSSDAFVAPVGPCVSFAGRLRLETKLVDQLSYVYTCRTKPGGLATREQLAPGQKFRIH